MAIKTYKLTVGGPGCRRGGNSAVLCPPTRRMRQQILIQLMAVITKGLAMASAAKTAVLLG